MHLSLSGAGAFNVLLSYCVHFSEEVALQLPEGTGMMPNEGETPE